jgi:hypothetical protein
MSDLRIMVDWGGALARDGFLFNKIAEKSGNAKTLWTSPASWGSVRSLGAVNYFDQISNGFFSLAEIYPQAAEVLLRFLGKKETGKQTFVVFDNHPELKLSPEKVQFFLAKSLHENGIEVNGVIVDSDKTKIAKTFGINVAIDDDPRIALALSALDVKTIIPLRKWNKEFNIDQLKLTTREDKIDKTANNLFFAEDWVEIGNILEFIGKQQP